MERQQGFVSLFTVMFFMILITIITVGFLRITGLEQQQATDNNLSSSALSAAEAGLEDGKRAILKYSTLTAGSPEKAYWQGVLNSPICNQINKDTTTRSALGLRADGQIGQSSLSQFYTCLTFNLNSPDYISHNGAGKSEFVPLRHEVGKSFDQVKVSWHLLSSSVGDTGDGVPGSYAPNTLLPPVTGSGSQQNWTNNQYPAYLRVQVYGVPNNKPFTRGDIDARTHTVFLVPNAIGISENTPIALDTADPRGIDQSKAGVQGIACKPINFGIPSSAPIGSYACAATLALPSDPLLNTTLNDYYARITPLYGATHFKLELQKSGSGVVNFSEVQPTIDSTGKTKDAFRRIQVRVRLDSPTNTPEYVVESVSDICKDMKITDRADAGGYYVNNCPAIP